MLFPGKEHRKSKAARHSDQSLYPVLYVTDSLKEYKRSGQQGSAVFVGAETDRKLAFPT